MTMFRAICLLLSLLPLWCAGQAAPGQDKPAYYLDMNRGNQAVYDIQDKFLNIQYHDLYGRKPDMPLDLLNEKGERVAQFILSKQYGLNHFRIDLGAAYTAWPKGAIYSCRMTDEKGKRLALLVRRSLDDSDPPAISIFVNPIDLACEPDPSAHLVDFYGTISGGKAPYAISWYIMNESRSALLYQPRTETVERPGNTVTTRIDQQPAYYVVAIVRDACGKEDQQMVQLVCEDDKKKINTVFVEPLRNIPKTIQPPR
jgi:hypothetical protein